MSDQVLAPTIFVDLEQLLKDGTIGITVGQNLAIVSIPPAERPGEASVFSVTVPAADAALLSQPAFKQNATISGQPGNTILEALLTAEEEGTVDVLITLQNGSILGDPKTPDVVSVVIAPALDPAPGFDA